MAILSGPCQRVPSCLASGGILHRTWRVLSFSMATIFIYLHQMSRMALSSAENLVAFDDDSLFSFCFSCPIPHEAGKGPAVCFWRNSALNRVLIFLYSRCIWAHRGSLALSETVITLSFERNGAKERQWQIVFVG